MPEYQSFISLDIWTALFALINMIIVFVVLKKFLFKPVMKIIDDRQKEIDDIYADAAKAKAEAQELQSTYTAKLSAANAESERILSAATRMAQQREEEILRDAQTQAARTLERAQEQIALEKKQAMHELKGQVSGIAVDIASKVLGQDVDGKKHQKLIDTFIDELGE